MCVRHCMNKEFGLETNLVEFTPKDTTPKTSGMKSASPEEREGLD